MIQAFLAGVALCLGLVLVFGPQNIFVLRTGIDAKYRFSVAFTSIVCEIILISIGIFGLAAWIEAFPIILICFNALGAAFLMFYGFQALNKAYLNHYEAHNLSDTKQGRPRQRHLMAVVMAVVMACNPASLTDTFIVVPALAGGFDFQNKLAMMLGHMITISVWFFTLAYASSHMRPIFKSPMAWRNLDIFVFLMMTYLTLIIMLKIYPLIMEILG